MKLNDSNNTLSDNQIRNIPTSDSPGPLLSSQTEFRPPRITIRSRFIYIHNIVFRSDERDIREERPFADLSEARELNKKLIAGL